jgi:hypothetical protein
MPLFVDENPTTTVTLPLEQLLVDVAAEESPQSKLAVDPGNDVIEVQSCQGQLWVITCSDGRTDVCCGTLPVCRVYCQEFCGEFCAPTM